MRKLFTLLLAVAASVGTLFAQKVQIGDLYYNLDATNQTAEVTSSSDKYSGDIIIPSSVTYNSVSYSVTSIGYQAFIYCSGLTSVTIGNSVTGIGGSAFSGCSSLTSITIPYNVTYIEEGAFDGCTGIKSIVWNAKRSFWPAYYYRDVQPLRGCTQVTSFVIGNGVEYIPGFLCFAMRNLNSVTISNSATDIGSYAFYGCTSLPSVTIPNSVTSIGASSFEECTGLTSLTIGNSVTTIGDYAFSGCIGLTSVTIPNSVTSIADKAFYNCTGLTSVTIGSGVTSIEDLAFAGCTGLTSITCKAVTPPCCSCNSYSGNGDVFYRVHKDVTPLYVPAGSVDAYMAAETWKDFWIIQAIDDSQPEETMTCAEAREAALSGNTANVSVVGYVTKIVESWSSKYKNISFWMADTKDGGRVFEAFRVKCNTQNEAPIVGDKVKITGKLSVYNSTTPEIEAGGTFEILEKAQAVEYIDVISGPCKVMIDGQIFILRRDKTYTTDGRLVR